MDGVRAERDGQKGVVLPLGARGGVIGGVPLVGRAGVVGAVAPVPPPRWGTGGGLPRVHAGPSEAVLRALPPALPLPRSLRCRSFRLPPLPRPALFGAALRVPFFLGRGEDSVLREGDGVRVGDGAVGQAADCGGDGGGF